MQREWVDDALEAARNLRDFDRDAAAHRSGSGSSAARESQQRKSPTILANVWLSAAPVKDRGEPAV